MMKIPAVRAFNEVVTITVGVLYQLDETHYYQPSGKSMTGCL